MDFSPNSSRLEHHSSFPIVRPTHVITILRTPRLIVPNGNSTSSMPMMRSTIQAHPSPLLDLVLQAQTPHTTCIYFLYLGKVAKSHIQAHTNMELCISSLKPGTLAQAKPSTSLRLIHLA